MKVRLSAPSSPINLFGSRFPKWVKKHCRPDRTKEPGAVGEPLYMDVINALAIEGVSGIKVVGGRYGLGSKDTPPASVFAVFTELEKEEPLVVSSHSASSTM